MKPQPSPGPCALDVTAHTQQEEPTAFFPAGHAANAAIPPNPTKKGLTALTVTGFDKERPCHTPETHEAIVPLCVCAISPFLAQASPSVMVSKFIEGFASGELESPAYTGVHMSEQRISLAMRSLIDSTIIPH